MFRIGDVIDNTYRLMEEIGRGGIGIIYKAYHLRLKKYVVLKKTNSNFSGVINDRIEVDLLKRLHHSYLPQVYDFLQFDNEVFMVMEYVDGFSLEDLLKKNCILDEKLLIQWLKELLEVLDYLHSQRPAIYHNDIKPGNIMITKDNHACLIDFNISLDETETDKILGLSTRYASPEQKEKAELASKRQYHENIKIDARSDLYSLGETFLKLIQNGNYSEGFNNVLQKAAYINKGDRFKNAKQMLKAVENISRYDSEYLRYRYIAIIGRSICAIMIILSILFVYWGYHIKVKESYEADCRMLNKFEIQSNYDEIVKDGISILNNISYSTIFRRSPETKAVILNAVGNAYCKNGNYTGSTEYYEEALECQKTGDKRSIYLRNCAIAYARGGSISEAERMLELAKEDAIDCADIEIISGEIAYVNNDRKMALQYFENAKEEANTAEVRVEALRRSGKLHTEYKSYKSAAECYEQIIKTKQATFEDQMNLAISYELLKKYEQSETILKSLLNDNGENYRVYMCLTRIAVDLKNNDQAKEYYKKAKECYKTSESDKNMEKLIDEMEQ
ncbi:MAG: protein kinase [Eubacterium sp.]